MSVQSDKLPDIELVAPTRGSNALREVIRLGRSAKATVGFLPDAAFEQRTTQRTLLAATIDDRVAAYVLYDLPRDEIRIVQLVVAKRHRGRGLARLLVDTIADAHPNRRGIVLRCRDDFPATTLWEKLDFHPVSAKAGRSLDGKLLTRWFRSFGQPDLFTFLHEQDTRPLAVLDASTFFDVVEGTKRHAEQLRADWIGEHARLAVADHILHEIHRGEDPDRKARQRRATEPLRLASDSANGWKEVRGVIDGAHPDAPPTDNDDLIHLAQAIAANATWLVTGDRRFIARYGRTAERIGSTAIVTPQQFLLELDETARDDQYRPAELADTDVTRRAVDATTLPDLAPSFVNHRLGDRIRGLRDEIDDLAVHPDARLEVIEVAGELRGLACWVVTAGSLDVLLARVTSGVAESTIGRHLLAMMRDEAVGAEVEMVRVLDERPSRAVESSFRDEGFALNDRDEIVAHPLTGRGTLGELHALATRLNSPMVNDGLFVPTGDDLVHRAALAERWFAPFVVLGAGLPTYYVPIRHGWATDLVDVGLAAGQLLPRPWRLGLRRELVYYRSPLNSRRIAAPARLVWYVSGDEPGAGNVRGVSHLTDVVVDEPKRLYQRFRALGVWTERDVVKAAGKGPTAMALRFTATRRLGPVPLKDYENLMAPAAVVLQSVHPIDEHTFVRILDYRPPHAT